jgi:hypothetical protein
MPMSPVIAGTPHYVLMDGNCRIGPKIVQSPAGTECSPIYGFSCKGVYDTFCMNSQLVLKPYPLVKGYLRNQVAASGNGLTLVVVDAAGPSEPYLQAATMEVVLEAQENHMAQVTTAYRLMFDQRANAYRVEEDRSDAIEDASFPSIEST